MTAAPELVVVCGLGRIGYRVARLLLELGVKVAALDPAVRADRARAVTEAGGEVIAADARDPVELARVGVSRARAIVAVTDSDLVNLEVALDARRLKPDIALALRVFDRDLARSLEQSFGGARAVGASALSAPALAFGALGREILAGVSVDDHEVLVGRVDLSEGSPLAGLDADALRERHGLAPLDAPPGPLARGARLTVVGERAAWASLPLEDPGASPRPRVRSDATPGTTLRTAWGNTPRALRRVFWSLTALTALSVVVFRFGMDPPISLVEALYFTATTVTTTGYGDITPRSAGTAMMIYGSLFMLLGSVTMAVLYSFATSFVVSEQLRRELGRPPIPRGGHVIVAGMGHVGYRAWAELRRADREVVAVDLGTTGELASAVSASHPFVCGDARLSATLNAASVSTAVAIVAATGDDAVNLAIALAARRLSPHIRTVVRVFDADFAGKLEEGRLVDLAVSSSRIAAPTFAAAALFDDVAVGFREDGQLVALCFEPIPPGWTGCSPQELGEQVPLVAHAGKLEPWAPREPLPAGCSVLRVKRRARGSDLGGGDSARGSSSTEAS